MEMCVCVFDERFQRKIKLLMGPTCEIVRVALWFIMETVPTTGEIVVSAPLRQNDGEA